MLDGGYVSLARGAYQVYDHQASAQMSELVASMLKAHVPSAYCFAGDWRGVQFLLDSADAAHDRDSLAYMFDPSRMMLDEVATYGAILDAQGDGSIANGADPDKLHGWLRDHGLAELPRLSCVGTNRFHFMQNMQSDAEAPVLDDEPMPMVSFVGAAGRMYLSMQ